MLDATQGAIKDSAAGRLSSADHNFVPGSAGPSLSVQANSTDQQLRQALEKYDHVQLMRVSLTESSKLLKCYEHRVNAEDMQRLSNMLFQHEWCYRPLEMTPEWIAVDRRGKPKRGLEPWCVWGFECKMGSNPYRAVEGCPL